MTAKTLPYVLTTTGGLDSTTLLYRYATGGREIYPVFVDYGQAQAVEIIKLVNFHIHLLQGRGCEVHDLRVEKFHFPDTMLPSPDGGPLFKKGYRPKKTGIYQDASTAKAKKNIGWVQCRNLMILTLCAAYAAKVGAALCTGHTVADIDQSDTHVIPDGTIDFLNKLTEVWGCSFAESPDLVCPFIEESAGKVHVLREAIARGIPIEKTTSCDYMPPCGVCGACTLAKKLKVKQWQPK